MLRIFRVIRSSNTVKGLEEKEIEQARAAISASRRTLENPLPDTFLGRKTREPFPREDEENA